MRVDLLSLLALPLLLATGPARAFDPAQCSDAIYLFQYQQECMVHDLTGSGAAPIQRPDDFDSIAAHRPYDSAAEQPAPSNGIPPDVARYRIDQLNWQYEQLYQQETALLNQYASGLWPPEVIADQIDWVRYQMEQIDAEIGYILDNMVS